MCILFELYIILSSNNAILNFNLSQNKLPMRLKKDLLKKKLFWRGALLFSPLLLAPSISNAQSFVYDSAVQNWPVPAGVIKISITAAGGQGGDTNGAGGYGAVFTGVCRVVPGDILSIVAAGHGGNSVVNDGHGGGGGSFVYDSNTLTLYVAAGGGGGGSYGVPPPNLGGNGGTDLVNNTGNPGSGPDGNALDGVGGNGGDTTTGWGPGGSGAGWISNGLGSGLVANYIAYGGMDRASGFRGGAINNSNPDKDWGGYGGGGGGGWDAGGGGGGYNGGGGGNDGPSGGNSGNSGDGGGSYLNGTLIGSAVATNTGNGYVNISYISLTTSTRKACFNGSNGMAIVTATGGTGMYTYLWAPGGQTKDTVSGLSAGTYTLMVSDSVGDYDSIPVVVAQESRLSATVTAPAGVCVGSCASLHISGSGGIPTYGYAWNNGSTVDSIFVCPATNTSYTCVVTDSLGCTYDTAFMVKANAIPTLTVSVTKDTACNLLTMDSLIGKPTGGTFTGTGVTGNNFNPSVAGIGSYTITYHFTDSLGCSNTDSTRIVVNSCAGIQEVSTGNGGFSLYPNPNNGTFSLQSNIVQVNSRLEVYNMLGETVINRECNGTLTQIDMGGNVSGLYMYRVITQSGTVAATGKFVVQK